MNDRNPSLQGVAATVLERSRDDQQAAIRMLLAAVMMNGNLLAELFGMSREQVRERCAEFLRGMGASVNVPIHSGIIPEPPRRAVNPERKKEARTRDAKAQLVRDLVQSAKGADPVQATKLARQTIDATLALAQREFDERIVANVDVRWGDLTMRHLESLEVNVAFLGELRQCLRELRDAGRFRDETTPLRDILSANEMREIKARCGAKREAAVHALESLKVAGNG